MKNFLLILAAIALLGSCGLPFMQNSAVGPAEAAGLTVVSIKPSTTDAELIANDSVNYGYIIVKATSAFDPATFVRAGVSPAGSFRLDGIEGVYYRLHKAEGVAKAIVSIRSMKGVLYAEPELLSKRVLPVSEDPTSRALIDGDLTGNSVQGAANEYSLAITKALQAYDTVGYGTHDVYVAVIDTGINMTHEDFWYDADGAGPGAPASIVQYAKSAFNKAVDGTMTWIGDGAPFVTIPIGENWDDEAHGTHVSGTIAAVGDNAAGVTGVAWKQTKIISYKCFAEAEAGSGADWSIYGALGDLADWVADQRANFGLTQGTIPVNMSLGGDYAGSFELEMINYAISEGVLPVVAMGNDGKRVGQFPASYQGVVAVGATNGRDQKVHFSNTGSWISVSAPGYDIYSTGNGSGLWDTPGAYRETEYQWMSGTSMATPFVTGTIGYLLSFNNGYTLTPYQVKSLLEQTADDLGAVGFDEDFGYGRVNLLAIATAVSTGVGIPVDGANYVNSKIMVSVANTSVNYDSGIVGFKNVVAGQAVYLYDSTGAFVSVGMTNGTDGTVEFRGLPAGDYTVKTNYFGDVGEQALTLTNAGDQIAAFSYNKNIVFICTVPNAAYNGGADGTDSVITIYSDEALTTVVAGPHDSSYLDTLQAELLSGTYYVKISSFGDDYSLTEANYGLQIGFTAISEVNLADVPTRLATADDSHEEDDTGAAATAKGAVTLDTPMAMNLFDEDVFMFVVP